jgi:hypothetical protein
LHGDTANNVQGAFDMPILDPFMGLLPNLDLDLQADIFDSLAGDEGTSHSMYNDSTINSWD